MQQSQRLQKVMELLGDETRYKMFEILLEDNNYCVSEVSALLGISPSAASQHFRMFELAGLVHKTRDGQRMCYRPQLRDTTVLAVARLMKQQRKQEVYA